jgi:cyanate permease
LVESIFKRSVALCLLDQVFRHFVRLLVILDQATGKERVLRVVALIKQIGDIIRLHETQTGLLLSQGLNVSQINVIENDLCNLVLKIHLLL